MKKVAIIQARMTSTRLPGKVLKELAGRPMLSQQLRRLRISSEIDEIVIATTTNATDNPLISLCNRERVRWFRGSENDVLSRYVSAARESKGDIVIRITSDCPLIDAGIVDQVVRDLTTHISSCDYAANILERTYPRGLDTEVFTHDTLMQLDQLVTTPSDREHVTSFLRGSGSAHFRCRSVKDSEDHSDLRWTVDTETDLSLVRTIYEDLDLDRQIRPYREILTHILSHPELTAVNAGIDTWDPTKH